MFVVLVVGQMVMPAIFNSPVNKISASNNENSIQTESVEHDTQNETVDDNVVEQNNTAEESVSNNQEQVVSERDLLILSLDNFIELLGNFDSYDCFAPFVENNKFKASLIPDESDSFDDVKSLTDSLNTKIDQIIENENSQETLSINLLRNDDEISNEMNDLYNSILNLIS